MSKTTTAQDVKHVEDDEDFSFISTTKQSTVLSRLDQIATQIISTSAEVGRQHMQTEAMVLSVNDRLDTMAKKLDDVDRKVERLDERVEDQSEDIQIVLDNADECHHHETDVDTIDEIKDEMDKMRSSIVSEILPALNALSVSFNGEHFDEIANSQKQTSQAVANARDEIKRDVKRSYDATAQVTEKLTSTLTKLNRSVLELSQMFESPEQA